MCSGSDAGNVSSPKEGSEVTYPPMIFPFASLDSRTESKVWQTTYESLSPAEPFMERRGTTREEDGAEIQFEIRDCVNTTEIEVRQS